MRRKDRGLSAFYARRRMSRESDIVYSYHSHKRINPVYQRSFPKSTYFTENSCELQGSKFCSVDLIISYIKNNNCVMCEKDCKKDCLSNLTEGLNTTPLQDLLKFLELISCQDTLLSSLEYASFYGIPV